MVRVRSVSTATWTDAGSERSSCGSSSLTRSATVMMFAPGCRWMLRMTAGVVFIHAASLSFSAPARTSATSPSLTGAPFRYAMTSGA